MRTYNSAARLIAPRKQVVQTAIPAIDVTTKLVNIETASQLLKAERGLELAPWTLREYCNSRKWEQGFFWVKRGRRYLINMDAVYHWVVYG